MAKKKLRKKSSKTPGKKSLRVKAKRKGHKPASRSAQRAARVVKARTAARLHKKAKRTARPVAPKKKTEARAPKVHIQAVVPPLTIDWAHATSQLLKKAAPRGFVTEDEILHSIPNIEDNIKALEKLYDDFDERGIEVISRDDATVWETTKVQKDRAGKSEAELSGYDLSDISEDSIQMYLREIGKIIAGKF